MGVSSRYGLRSRPKSHVRTVWVGVRCDNDYRPHDGDEMVGPHNVGHILQVEGADPQRDRVVLEIFGVRTIIVVVSDPEQAAAIAVELGDKEGVALIELDGGLGVSGGRSSDRGGSRCRPGWRGHVRRRITRRRSRLRRSYNASETQNGHTTRMPVLTGTRGSSAMPGCAVAASAWFWPTRLQPKKYRPGPDPARTGRLGVQLLR